MSDLLLMSSLGLPRTGLVALWDFATAFDARYGTLALQNGSTSGSDANDGVRTDGYGFLCNTSQYALSAALTGIDLAGDWTVGLTLISNGTTPGLATTVLSLAQADAEDNYVAVETSPPTFSTGAEAEAKKHCNVRLHVKNGATDAYSTAELYLQTSVVHTLLLEANGNALTLTCKETGESCTVTQARATATPRMGVGVNAKATPSAPVNVALYKELAVWSRNLSASEDERTKNWMRSVWRSKDSSRAGYATMAALEDELTTQVKAKLATGFDATERANWTSLIESLSAGKNTVLWVSDGAATPKYFPSVMVIIPQFTCESVLTGGGTAPHPAFVVGSTIYDNLYIAKYLACFVESNSKFLPLSLRGVDPSAGGNSYKDLNGNALPNTGRLTFDDAWTFGKNPGTGWHCMTNAEWAAVALACKANVFNPRGNNSYGGDVGTTSERGVPSYTYNSSGIKIGRTLAGSGPLGWSHDGTPFGIADLNGNVLEWNPGLRQYRGEIHICQNNDMADPANVVTLASTAWKAVLQDGTLAETVWRTGWTPALNTLLSVWGDTAADWRTYKCTTSGAVGGSAPTWYATGAWVETVNDGAAVWTLQTGDANKTLKLQPATATAGPLSLVLDVTVRTTASVGVQFKDIVAGGGVTVPNILKLLGIVPDGSAYTYGNDYLYWRNDASGSYAETLAHRGGRWYSGASGGVFYANLNGDRSISGSNVGFRPAFVGVPS